MRYSLFLVLVALASSIISGIAHTQTAIEPTVPKYMARFDARFRAADKDGDGALSREEARAAGLDRVVDNFDRLDANKDGKVSREEIRALLRSRPVS